MIKFGHRAMFHVISLFILYLEINASPSSALDVRQHKNWRLIDHGTSCGRGISIYSEEEQSNLWTKTFIKGGENADWNDYPWMAKFRMIVTTKDFPGHIKPLKIEEFGCGSSVINNRYLLTAAHCCTSPAQGQGSSNYYFVGINPGESESPPDWRDVDKVIIHEGYNPDLIQNDICLIRLEKPLSFVGAVQPICLPREPKWQTKDLDGLGMTIAGWGLLSRDPDVDPPTLQAVNVTVAPTEDCVRQWKGKAAVIPEKELCAGNSKKDACSGDSGGPIMYWDVEDTPRYFLSGLVSFGEPCTKLKNDLPGVFTRTSYYIPWILDNIHE